MRARMRGTKRSRRFIGVVPVTGSGRKFASGWHHHNAAGAAGRRCNQEYSLGPACAAALRPTIWDSVNLGYLVREDRAASRPTQSTSGRRIRTETSQAFFAHPDPEFASCGHGGVLAAMLMRGRASGLVIVRLHRCPICKPLHSVANRDSKLTRSAISPDPRPGRSILLETSRAPSTVLIPGSRPVGSQELRRPCL
jgi:hypothetical protein